MSYGTELPLFALVNILDRKSKRKIALRVYERRKNKNKSIRENVQFLRPPFFFLQIEFSVFL